MRSYVAQECKKYSMSREYYNWLRDAYKKFKNDNKKTVMYLVKEFEMKKSATAYTRERLQIKLVLLILLN